MRSYSIISQQDGTYTLVAFDEHWEPYLYSLGVPSFAIPLILRASETLKFTTTEKGATMVTETGETASHF